MVEITGVVSMAGSTRISLLVESGPGVRIIEGVSRTIAELFESQFFVQIVGV